MKPKQQDLAQEIFNRHHTQQEQRWQKFKEILFEYRKDYGANVEELTKGLMCSRQRLYVFFKEPQSGLPNTTPASLLTLWDLLTSRESEYWLKLKPEFREKRKSLERLGPNPLLTSLGFQPQSQLDIDLNAEKQIKVDNPQVHRVISRLNSPRFKDDIERTDIATEVLDLILKRGRCTKDGGDSYLSTWDDIEEWFNENLGIKQNYGVVEKYESVIHHAIVSGKQNFSTEELLELYHSINEHEDLNNARMPNNIHIIDCQFRTLSHAFDAVDNETKRAFLEAEKQLSSSLDSYPEIELSSQNPVLEVAITCNFSYGKQTRKNVIWRHSSTADHLQNMIAAVKEGVGYPFGYRDISTEYIDRVERSLMRTEVTLIDPKQNGTIYQGWWVDYNMLLGLLRAMVDAVKRWLAVQERVVANIERYFEAFQQRAKVAAMLFIGRASFYSITPDLNYKILDKCVEDIQTTTESFLQDVQKDHYHQENASFLSRASYTAQLTQMHVSLLEGNVKQASDFFSVAYNIVINASLANENSARDNVLILNASSCVMFYFLMKGDTDFLNKKRWRQNEHFSLETNAKKLAAYIDEKGWIDSDAYLYASQFWGTVSYIEFYTAKDSKDIPYLEETIPNFLAAAHYAFRIGHTKRAIHWLAYVSRVYCRLGKPERAKYYSHLSSELSARSSMPPLGDSEPLMTYPEMADTVYDIGSGLTGNQKEWLEDASPEKNRNWSMINVSISEGEIEMFLGNYEKAIDHFWESLEISIETGFSRLSTDSIYNLYRASKHVNTKSKNRIFNEYNSGEPFGKWKRNSFTQRLFNFFYSLGEDIEWPSESENLSELAQSIWTDWVETKDDANQEHPFSTLIREDSFLNALN